MWVTVSTSPALVSPAVISPSPGIASDTKHPPWQSAIPASGSILHHTEIGVDAGATPLAASHPITLGNTSA